MINWLRRAKGSWLIHDNSCSRLKHNIMVIRVEEKHRQGK